MLLALFAMLLVAPAYADSAPPTLSFQTDPADLSRWWSSNVNVAITAVDADGVASITCDGLATPMTSAASPYEFTVDQEGITDLRCRAVDNADNVSDDLVLPSIKIDKTAPTIARELINQPSYNDGNVEWFSGFVRYRALASDVLSGLQGSGAQEVWFTSEGGGQRYWFRFDDNAGNCAILAVGEYAGPETTCVLTRLPAVGLDFHPCTARVTISPTPNAAGWNRTPITIRWEATDGPGGSGMITDGRGGYELPVQEFTDAREIIGSVRKRFSDNVFLECSVDVTWKIDRTPPQFDAAQNPPKNANGWNRTDVAVHVQAYDAFSGLVTTPTTLDAVKTEEGRSFVELLAKDAADNEAHLMYEVLIDRTPPQVTFTKLPFPNADGWNNTPVKVQFTALDHDAGFNCSAPSGMCFGQSSEVQINFETSDHSVGSPIFTDRAGNQSLQVFAPVKVDMTPPHVSQARSPGPNAYGWNNSDVSVQFDASDPVSGVVGEASRTKIFNQHLGPQYAQEIFFDRAGNRTIATEGPILLDKLAPAVIGVSRFPFANEFGWNASDVTVRWDVTDSGSGIENLVDQMFVTLSQEGANQRVSRVFTDRAGNSSAPAELGGINIDKTRPVVATSGQSPEPNEHGWNNTDVTVHFEAADALSGIAGAPADDVLVREEGHPVARRRFTDRAGNSVDATRQVKIDKTAPFVSCFATPSTLWPPNRQLVPISMGLFFYDGDEYSTPFSGGPANGITLQSVFSSIPSPGDILGWEVGMEDTTGELMAWRGKAAPTYTFTYEASDLAGNSSTCTTSVVVARPQQY